MLFVARGEPSEVFDPVEEPFLALGFSIGAKDAEMTASFVAGAVGGAIR